MTEGNSRVRLTVVGVVVMALFSGLFARLWFLQVASSTSYAAQTRANRIRVLTEPAVRGGILDTNGRPLVENRLVDSIEIRRGLTDPDRKVMVPRLAKVLHMKVKLINKLIDSPRYSPYQPVPIADDVPYDTLVYIKERPELFPNVEVVRRSVRDYPNQAIAPHLLGYVGAINAHELKLYRGQGYEPDAILGKDGVEQMFESELRGKPRVRKLEIDSRGRLVGVLSDKAAVAGNDVQLTMNLDVQRVAEESLKQGMKEASGLHDPTIKQRFTTYGAKGGAAVVLDATDGSVVALASEPDFPVDQFTNGIPIDLFNFLTDPANNYPLLDRAIQGQYAPGSTFKPITAVAALEDGITTPDEVFDDHGYVEFGDPPNVERFSNAGKEVHGAVMLPTAIQVSSDAYFFTMGFRFWRSFNKGDQKKGYGIQEVARQFGFGRATGVGLPNEAVGRVPDGTFKARFNRNSPHPEDRVWLPGDSAHLAVGQGDLLVTPLQMASAYAAFANGGTLYAPRVAKEIVSPGSETNLRDLPPEKVGKIDLKPEVRGPIMDGMKGVVEGIGTAAGAFQDYQGMPIAGKTGTAQVAGKHDTSVFVGIVNPDPPLDPKTQAHQYVVVVFVEEGGNGASVAAPITRRIIDAINGNPNPPAVRLIAPKVPRGD